MSVFVKKPLVLLTRCRQSGRQVERFERGAALERLERLEPGAAIYGRRPYRGRNGSAGKSRAGTSRSIIPGTTARELGSAVFHQSRKPYWHARGGRWRNRTGARREWLQAFV